MNKLEITKLKKNNKGITLIALVVTIVVLIILAGITIASVTGEKGIIKEARTAKELSEKAALEELVELSIIKAEQKHRNPGIDDVIEELKNNKVISKDDQVNKETGSIITDAGYEITGKLDDYIGKVSVGDGNTAGDENTPSTPNLPTVIPGQIVTGGSKEHTNNGTAVIPEGFAIVAGCDDVSQGLVISDNAGDTELDSSNIVANGNQFVWVPVTNMANFKAIEGYYNGSLDSKLSNCSEPFEGGYATEEAEYNSMKQSVEENQGFYIGRYEAGKDTNGNLVVKKNSPVYNNIKWGSSMSNITGGAVELSKNFTKGKSYQGKVTSTLVYGIQWDATMQFFDSNYVTGTCDENSYVRDSTDKGNYSRSIINTGSNENYKVKNIYDMAGNVYEWTMEAHTTYHRVVRGGDYSDAGSTHSVSFRNCNNTPSGGTTSGYRGFRVALIL